MAPITLIASTAASRQSASGESVGTEKTFCQVSPQSPEPQTNGSALASLETMLDARKIDAPKALARFLVSVCMIPTVFPSFIDAP